MGQRCSMQSPDVVSPLAAFRITSLRSGEALMRVETEDGQQMSALIRLVDVAAWVFHEASQGAAKMVLQSRLSSLHARQVAMMLRRGSRPDVENSLVQYDPATKSYRYLLQFPNRAPVPVLLTEEDIEVIRAKQEAARVTSLTVL